ncbi:MAG: histidine phosphatase family protein, partial [Deltaproteobacteria bacterium]|nr:histidine phosphatase family protein [Deltaproteobacteria bacterium]
MAILLLRHGNSVRRDGLDAARPLSQAGRKEIEATIERAAQELLGQRIGFCVSSHLVRAVQSAEIACATFKKARVEVPAWIDADPCFEPDANPLVAAQRLEALEAEHGTVLCL